MADTYTIKGGASVIFGTDALSTGGAALGTILSFSKKDTGKYELVEGKQGEVTGVVIYDTETVITMEIMISSTATQPAVGTTMACGTVTGLVLDSELKAGNKENRKYSVSVYKWANVTFS